MSVPQIPEGKYAPVGDDLKMHYQEAGPSHGSPVVFFHGSGPGASGWSNFKRNYPAFAERGYRCLVPDTLGFGYSDKPDVDYGLEFLLDLFDRFLDHLGLDKVALVGNSHGGAQAIGYALRRPERVSKLILMAPGGLEVRETYMKMEGIRTMMKAFLSPDGITREAMRKVFGLQLYDPTGITDEIIEERYAIAVDQPKRVLTTLGVPHLQPELSRLEMPVFAFWGMQDRFCPPTGAQAIAQSCPSARVLLLQKCGHWVMVEYPELFNRMSIDFLDEQ